MALYVNTDKLDSAGENLTNSYGYFNSAISNISSGKSGLDSGVLSSVSSSLSTASSNLNLILSQTKSLSESILNASDKYKKAESNGVPGAATAGLVAGAATGAAQVTQPTKKEEEKGFWAGVGDWFVSAGASIANTAISLVKGVANFGEAIVDTVAIVGTAAASVITGLVDLGQWIYSSISGEEVNYITDDMWGGVMDFVGAKWVNKGFDYAYSNWGWLKAIDEHSWAWCQSDGIIYKIGEGIGYVAGIIALTVATAGIGTAASGAASAGGAATGVAGAATSTAVSATATTTAGAITVGSTTVTASQLATTAAIAGFGKGAQDKRAEGGSVLESLGAGTISAAWDGLSFYLGGKMQGQWGSQIANKIAPAASPLGQQLTTSGVRIAFDTSLGAADSFIRTGVDTIGADGYYNQDGIWTQFAPGTSYADRYKMVFEQNGGWAGVGQTMATAGVMSTITEGIDMVGFLRNNSPKLDADTATPKPTNRIVQAATDKIDKLKTTINDKLDASLVKKVTEENNKIFTEAFDSASTTAKMKALIGDTALVKSAKSLVNNITDAASGSKLGQVWKQIGDEAAMNGVSRTKVISQHAMEALSGSKVGKTVTSISDKIVSGYSTAKAGISDYMGKTKLGQAWKQIGDEAAMAGVSKGKVVSQHIAEALSGTKVVKGTKALTSKIADAYGTAKAGVSDYMGKTKLGQAWKQLGDEAAMNGVSRTKVISQHAIEALSGSKVGKTVTSISDKIVSGYSTAKAGVSDYMGKTKLGQAWKQLGDEAAEAGVSRTRVISQHAIEAISGSKVGKTVTSISDKIVSGYSTAKAGVSDYVGKTKLGQTWKQIGDEAAMAGVSKGKVVSQHIAENLSGTKVGKYVVSKLDNIKLGINEKLDGILAKRVTDANNETLTKAFDSTSTREKVKAIINDVRGKTVKEAANESTELAIRNEVAKNAGENVAKTISNSFSEQLRKEGIEIIGTKVNKDGRLYYIIKRNGMKDMVEAETGRLLNDKSGGVVTAIRDMYNQTKTTSTSPTAINDQINNMAGLLDGPPSKVASKESPISWNTAKYVLRNGARVQVTASQ